jgi:bacillithiol biosynthesis deacetylase BshB1
MTAAASGDEARVSGSAIVTDVQEVDVLVFGPHADDIELGLAGTIARHTAEGTRVGLCDLTRAELSSNGTPEDRLVEARAAAEVLGVSWRENLGWADGGIDGTSDQIRSVVEMIRQARPQAVAIPYWNDRHPDHVAASEVLRRAIFKSGLRRFDTGQPHWHPAWICHYFINDGAPPSFVVDVSSYYDKKRAALACYRSQFATDIATVSTRLNTPAFRALIESRDAQFGALAGVAFAEGIIVREPILRSGLLK